MIDRRRFLAGTGMVAAGAISRRLYAQAGPPRRGADVVLTLDLGNAVGALSHYWEMASGSDRTAVGFVTSGDKTSSECNARRECNPFGATDFSTTRWDRCGRCRKLQFPLRGPTPRFHAGPRSQPLCRTEFHACAFASSGNRIFAYKGNTSPQRTGRIGGIWCMPLLTIA